MAGPQETKDSEEYLEHEGSAEEKIVALSDFNGLRPFDETINLSKVLLTIDTKDTYSPSIPYKIDAYPVDYRVHGDYLQEFGNNVADVDRNTWIKGGEDFYERTVMFPGPIAIFTPKNAPVGSGPVHFRHYLPQYKATGEMSKFLFVENCILSYSMYAGKEPASTSAIPNGLPPSIYLKNYVRIGLPTDLVQGIYYDIFETEKKASGINLTFDTNDDNAHGVTWFIAKLPKNSSDGGFKIHGLSNGKVITYDPIKMMEKKKKSLRGRATVQFRANLKASRVNSSKKPNLEATLTSFLFEGTETWWFGGQTGAEIRYGVELTAELIEEMKDFQVA